MARKFAPRAYPAEQTVTNRRSGMAHVAFDGKETLCGDLADDHVVFRASTPNDRGCVVVKCQKCLGRPGY